MPSYEEMQAWVDANPPRPIKNMILSSPERLLISDNGSADFILQGSKLEIIIDGDGLVDVITNGDLLFGVTEEYASQGETINLDLLPGTPIILQGGSGTFTMTSVS